MYKILIADDEPKIRRGLRQIIEKSELDVCVCAEAQDGEEAYDLAVQFEPDILIVDICMPFLSGLEFIKKLTHVRDDVMIIVISGHDEFTYAQQALQLGVHAYMLKPVDKAELCSTIGEAAAALQKRRNANKHFEWAVEQLNKQKELLQGQFFNEWVAGNMSAEEVRQYVKYFDMRLPENPVLLTIVPSIQSTNNDIWSRSLVQFAIQNVLGDLLEEHSPLYAFVDDRENITVLLDGLGGDVYELAALVKRTIFISLEREAKVCALPVKNLYRLDEEYRALEEQVLLEQSHSPAVINAQKIIEHRFMQEDLGLADVAGEIGINASYLSRLMKQELGVSYIEYLTRVRIRKALELMEEGDIKIKTIAQNCGYSTQHYFSNAFKKTLGVSPQDYKKRKCTQ